MDTIATLCDSFLTLEACVKTDLVQLRTEIFNHSELSGKDETKWEEHNHENRANQLDAAATQLRELESTVLSLIEVVRSMAQDVAANFRPGEIMSRVELPQLAQLCVKQREWIEKRPTAEDNPFAEYQRAAVELGVLRRMAKAISVIHGYSPAELACILARFLPPANESPPPFIADGAVDWVTVNRVLLRVRNLHLHFRKVAGLAAPKAGNTEPNKHYFCQTELSRLERKVRAVERILLENFDGFFTRYVPEKTEAQTEETINLDQSEEDFFRERMSAFRDLKPLMVELGITAEFDWRYSVQRAWSVTDYIDTAVRWREEDIEEDPAYMEPNQILQSYFRNIITHLTIPKVVAVRGDGNCFFRAVVKFLWPTVSQFYEELLSHRLRALINPRKEKPQEDSAVASSNGSSENQPQPTVDQPAAEASDKPAEAKTEPAPEAQHISASVQPPEQPATAAETEVKSELHSSDPYKGFIIPDVNDPSTMANPGVWADHVQVQKAADLFRRPIWLIRYDDINLKFDKAVGGFVPGPDYRIGAHQDGSPITLYFTPETHYEVIAMDPAIIDQARNFTLLDAINELRQGPTQAILKSEPSAPLDNQHIYQSAEHMCKLAFALEKITESIEEKFAVSVSATDYSLRQEFRSQLVDDADRAKNSIVALKQLITAVRIDHFARPLRQDMSRPEGILLDGVLAAISEDGIKASANGPHGQVEPAVGPLSSLFARIQYCRSNGVPFPVSSMIDSMRANKKAEERRMQDLLRRQPSRGLLSALAESDESPLSDSHLDMEGAAKALELLADQTSVRKATVVVPPLGPPVQGPTTTYRKPIPMNPRGPVPSAGTHQATYSNTAISFGGQPAERPRQLNYHHVDEPSPKRQKVSEPESQPPGSGRKPELFIGSPSGSGLESKNVHCQDAWEDTFRGATEWTIKRAQFSVVSFQSLVGAAFASRDLRQLRFDSCEFPGPCRQYLADLANLASRHVALQFENCRFNMLEEVTRVMHGARFVECKFEPRVNVTALSDKKFYGHKHP